MAVGGTLVIILCDGDAKSATIGCFQQAAGRAYGSRWNAGYYTLAVLKGKEKRRVMIEVELKNISKTIHKTPILHDINLKFHSGAIYGLKGKNGCGKTMLMRTICGLMIPSTGTVSINGKVLMKDIEFPESIGALIENPAFPPQYT
jgi:ABC-type transport system involved in cytochrome bd biosynthesis fused ATPase/permease subunit